MLSRKFILSCAFFIVLSAALFLKFISDGNFIAGMGIIIGLYSGANVVQKKIEDK